jgi:hypothetical protein
VTHRQGEQDKSSGKSSGRNIGTDDFDNRGLGCLHWTELDSAVRVKRRAITLVPVRARAELVMALVLGQAWEAPGQARVWGWAERPVRQRLVPLVCGRSLRPLMLLPSFK